jgi:cold shock CspA family protein
MCYVQIRLRIKETNKGKVHTFYTPAGFGWIDKVGCMGISTGNKDMFLVGNHKVKAIGTCTENPRVGSSILSLGTSILQGYQ